MRSQGYAPVAIGLHWLIALAILFQISLGWRMDDHAHGASTYLVFQLHKSVGITILLLSLVRLGWRLLHPPPPLPDRLAPWERQLAALTHVGFYGVMIGLPLTGWLIVSASKTQIPTLLYGTIPWPHLPGLAHASSEIKAAWRWAGEAGHGVLAKLTYLLFALHLAGAIKHHLLDRNDTFSRMIPGVKSGAWLDPRAFLLVLGAIAAFLGGQQIFSGGGGQPPSALTPRATYSPSPSKTSTPDAAHASSPSVSSPPVPPAGETAASSAPRSPSNWTVEPGGRLTFATSWSGQAVTGEFRRWTARVRFAPDALDTSSVEVTIDPSSIDTGDAQRDATLPTEDWLNTQAFPRAVFKADQFRKTPNGYMANGRLSLRGQTRPLQLEFNVQIVDDKALASGRAVVDRTLFGVGQGEYASVEQIPANVEVRFEIRAHKSSAH